MLASGRKSEGNREENSKRTPGDYKGIGKTVEKKVHKTV
jgi:hypothetical protein